MTFNYKAGLFRIWLVLSLLWVVLTAWAGFRWGAVAGVPLAFGVVLYLVVWAIRGFGVKQTPPALMVNLTELRQELSQTTDPEAYKTEMEPLLDQLEAKYGSSSVPLGEIQGFQNIIRGKVVRIGEQKQEIIDREAKKGATIELDALRRTLEASKATYAGPDRENYVSELDKLLDSLATKYGTRIPVDHAYRIMQKLEAGLGYSADD